MSQTSYFNRVTTKSAHAELLATSDGRTLAQLQKDPLSASHWTREHLLACRVICPKLTREHTVLPKLEPYLAAMSPVPQHVPAIRPFLDGPPTWFRYASEHQMHRDHGTSLGQVWAALASVMREGDLDRANLIPDIDQPMTDSDDSPPRKRARTQMVRENFVDPETQTFEDSSPLGGSNSQGSTDQGSVGFVDRLTHDCPEDETLYLASSVIRHILCHAPPQDQAHLPRVVEFRVAKRFIAAQTNQVRIRASDDGGLCLRERREPEGRFVVTDEHVALLEAKRDFQQIKDGRPVVTDRLFAQMTCEAIACALRKSSENSAVMGNEDVFVINATRNYMRFLHFHMSQDYLENLDSDSYDAYLAVQATQLFDLNQDSGRLGVLRNLIGIVQYRLGGSNEEDTE